MLKQLHQACDECPIPVTFEHIYGHQDRTKTYDLLDRPSQLNVLADMYATDHRMHLEHTYGQNQAPETSLPCATAQLRHSDGIITGKEKYWLRTRWPLLELQYYLMDKFEWTLAELRTVDFEAMSKARKATTPAIRQFMTKLSIGFLPLNERLCVIEGKDPHCPSCPEIETQTHLYQCTNRKGWQGEFLCKLSKHLRKTHTPHLIKDFLLCGLQLQIDNIPMQERPPKYRSQNTFLSYHDLLCGRISENLTDHMTNHLQNNPPPSKDLSRRRAMGQAITDLHMEPAPRSLETKMRCSTRQKWKNTRQIRARDGNKTDTNPP
jgi:hypothetical protein